MPSSLYKTLHSPRVDAAGAPGVARRVARCRAPAAWAPAAWILAACLLLSGPEARAADNTPGQSADAVERFIRAGVELADAYAAGPVCGRIAGDVERVRGARAGSEAAMKRLLLVENDPRQEMLRGAFRRANESALRLERTLDGAGAVCRQGGDARMDATGYRLRLENEALFLAENGRTLCRTLRAEVPGMVWPDCDRP